MSLFSSHDPARWLTVEGVRVQCHAMRAALSHRELIDDTRQLGPQGTQALPHRDAALQQERTDLIDDAGTLTDQSIADAVQRLKVELIGGLGRDELHGWSLHSLADGFRISEVILLSRRIGPHVFGRHQPGIVAKHLKLAAEMMRANAGLHADQAR